MQNLWIGHLWIIQALYTNCAAIVHSYTKFIADLLLTINIQFNLNNSWIWLRTLYTYILYIQLTASLLTCHAGPIEYESDPSSDVDKNYFSDQESLTG